MAPRLSGEILYFFVSFVSFVSQFSRDLETKTSMLNIKVFPESSGVVLEY